MRPPDIRRGVAALMQMVVPPFSLRSRAQPRRPRARLRAELAHVQSKRPLRLKRAPSRCATDIFLKEVKPTQAVARLIAA